MEWLIAMSWARSLVFAVLAFLIVLQLLVWLDRRAGFDWKGVIAPLLMKDAKAMAIYKGARIIAIADLIGRVIAGCIVLGALAAPAAAATTIPSTYDRQIKAAAETWLPGVPWRLWKAQLYQESRLDPAARSGVGAEGLAQFMPATWVEVSKAMGLGAVDRRAAEPAILGGAYYMAQLRRRWTMVDLERHRFAAAGYNAGNGSIGRARRACDGGDSWEIVAGCLPDVTGKHAAETTGYIRQIFDRWWPLLEGRA